MADDLIRKSDVLETYADLYDIFDDNKAIQEELHKVFDKINDIPTVEPKRGEWIDYSCGSGCYCSNCGWDGDDIIDECIIQDFDFCPNCGARMKGADDE